MRCLWATLDHSRTWDYGWEDGGHVHGRKVVTMEPGRRSVADILDVPAEGASPGDAITEYYLAWRAALLRRMRTRLDETAAEDVVQEIFLQAYRDFGRYDSTRSSPKTWLLRIGDQVQARYFRSLYGMERAQSQAPSDLKAATPLTPEEREDLRGALRTLTPLNCRIVTARFLLGDSVEEIAAQNGLSEEAVKKRISLSLEALRRRVAA